MNLSSRFEEALIYVARLHANQVRKGTTVPYLAHLLAVAGLVLEHGGGEDEAIAALLHDAIEDQGGTAVREEIRRRFGDTVAEITDGCTDAETLPKPPWPERKRAHLARLGNAPPAVLQVFAADKLDNARAILKDYRSLGEALWTRFKGGKDGTLWYYRAAVEILRRQSGPLALIEELDCVVSEIERLSAR